MPFLLLGDRRKAQDVPFWFDVDRLPLLDGEQMADGVVFLQAQHDDDDASGELVIEAAAERVVVPHVDRVAPLVRALCRAAADRRR